MPDPSWFEVTAGADLAQGDILLGCPVPCVDTLALPLEQDQEIPVVVQDLDLSVVTQSCDLEHDKVNEVLLAEVVAWDVVKRSGDAHLKKTEFRKALVQGNVPGYSLLRKSEESVSLPWSLADFHRLHVLPKGYVEAFADQTGNRLRLLPPYREHVSQAFARFFMRVGLPHDGAAAFVEEGK
jgi:hypothetical protein